MTRSGQYLLSWNYGVFRLALKLQLNHLPSKPCDNKISNRFLWSIPATLKLWTEIFWFVLPSLVGTGEFTWRLIFAKWVTRSDQYLLPWNYGVFRLALKLQLNHLPRQAFDNKISNPFWWSIPTTLKLLS